MVPDTTERTIMLGAITPGTVGSLASGRLVLVESIDQFAARLVSLPDQPPMADNTWDGRFTGPFKASPFVSIEPVDTTTLSTRNRHFLESGEVLPAPYVPEPIKVRASRSKGPSAQRLHEMSCTLDPRYAPRPTPPVKTSRPVVEIEAAPERPGYALFVHAWRSPANLMSRYISHDMKGCLYLENAYMAGIHPPYVYVKLT